MRNAAAAEWILSLVTPPDRAASTVGDLLEQSSARGVLWFWSSVSRTACSHFWRDLSASPLQMVRLAFWGWLATLVTALFFVLPVLFLLRIGQFEVPLWFYSVLKVVAWTAVPFLVGWKLARRSGSRELAAVFAVACLSAALTLLRLYLAALQMRRIGRPWPGGEHAVAEFRVTTLLMAAGAILFRRRAIKGVTDA